MSLEVVSDHTVHPRFISERSVVVDLGANRGDFSAAMVERFGCRCIAVEPSPIMFRKIEARERVEKHHLAIAPSTGPVAFHLSELAVASSMMREPSGTFATVTVAGKTLEQFCRDARVPSIDVLKMDIEGAEIGVIDACSDELLRRIGQITVEFHDHAGLVSKAEVRRVIRRLHGLGFRHFSRYLHSYYDTLFLNRRLCPISPAEDAWNRHVLRNWHGLVRRMRRQASAIGSTRPGSAR